ncbi:uncharacterized protein B0J16DRAFT_276191 [Fusarium flagelliforme]|uniref:uncharacterized protein n=1 Tax=Fusarium flagelliforme TaxID=2675880 RepID=UPI001E8CD8FB|nr:uncharacterized protein B0J16DRAFT_276191 [Fusarium flagelliforme]KAH7174072.1 hypothetical protein B0J16DRAFT_276191 [Fusarium flagelliforme]
MRVPLCVALACLVCQAFSVDVAGFLNQVPDCAKHCFVQPEIPSTCGSEINCICADQNLHTQAVVCVEKACLPREALTTRNVTSTACEFPIRDRHVQFDILAVTLNVVSGIVVGLRIWEKLRYERLLRADDYITIACFAVSLGLTVMCVYGLSGHGLGRDAWQFSGDTITTYLCYIYVIKPLYITTVFLTKISILLFYLRIFPTIMTRKLIWGTIATTGLGTVVFDTLAITQCQPIHFAWNGWDKLHKGHCVGVGEMKWKRKLAVALMFALGTFVSIVSIVRLRVLIASTSFSNPTWNFYETCYWSVIEGNVGIWCVCMPDLRLLIVRFLPGSRSTFSSSYAHESGPSRRQEGRTADNAGIKTDRSVYNQKTKQMSDEASSSTAELVELTVFEREIQA